LHKDKSVFKLDELPVDQYAASLGLPGAPKIKFLSKEIAKQKKNASRTVAALQAEITEEQSAKKDNNSDNGSDEDEDSSADEEESAPTLDSIQLGESTVKPSKVYLPPIDLFPSTKFSTLARRTYQIRPDVRTQKSKVRTLW
jgi:ATP-dependent RNA helicase DDX10/DBP4